MIGERARGGGGELRDLKTRRKDDEETQVRIFLLTDSPTELEAEYNTLVGIASNPQLSIF